MNLGQLKTAFYNAIGGSASNSHVSATEVVDFLNEEQRRLFHIIAAKEASFFEAITYLSEVASTEAINLPTDCYQVIRIQRVGGISGASETNPFPMTAIQNSNDADWNTNPGYSFESMVTNRTPSFYQVVGQKKLRLRPRPTASNTNSLKLFYIYRPADMGSDANVPFQQVAGSGGAGLDNLADWHDLLWRGAVLQAYAKEADVEVYQLMRNEYQERMGELRAYLDRVYQAPRFIQVSPEDSDMFDF